MSQLVASNPDVAKAAAVPLVGVPFVLALAGRFGGYKGPLPPSKAYEILQVLLVVSLVYSSLQPPRFCHFLWLLESSYETLAQQLWRASHIHALPLLQREDALLVDVRTNAERTAQGLPDLQRSALSKGAVVPLNSINTAPASK